MAKATQPPITRAQLGALVRRYGRRRLAELVGVHPSSVYRWQKTRIPEPRKAVLAKLKAAPDNDRKALAKFLKLAARKNLLSKTHAGQKHREGIRTGGYEYTARVDRFLAPDSIVAIEKVLGAFKPPKRFKRWIASAKFYQMVQITPAGYPTVQIQIPGKSVNESLSQSVESSGNQSSQKAAIAELRKRLLTVASKGEAHWIESAYISTFYWLSDEQLRARAAKKRAEARKREKQRAAKRTQKHTPVKKKTGAKPKKIAAKPKVKSAVSSRTTKKRTRKTVKKFAKKAKRGRR